MKMYSATKIPLYIREMANKLNLGEMRAIHADSKDEDAAVPSFVFFIIRESDVVIQSLGKSPTIEAIAGMIDVAIAKQRIFCVPTLFRFCANPQLTYLLEYNLAALESLSTYCALGKQQAFDFLFCGETQERVITVNLPHLTDHISENIEIAKQKTGFNWSEDAYLSAKQVVNDVDRKDLWEIFQQHGSLLELNRNHF